jgi:4-carboxymuconolactone decarboxylase
MKPIDFTRPRAAARPFTPKLSDFVEQPLYSDVWTDADLAPRDRSLITIACLIALNHSNELPAHLRRV